MNVETQKRQGKELLTQGGLLLQYWLFCVCKVEKQGSGLEKQLFRDLCVCMCVCPSLSDSTFLSLSLPPAPPPPLPILARPGLRCSRKRQLRALSDQFFPPLAAVVGKIRPSQDSLCFSGALVQDWKAGHFSLLHVPGVCGKGTSVTNGGETPDCCIQLLGRRAAGGSSSTW